MANGQVSDHHTFPSTLIAVASRTLAIGCGPRPIPAFDIHAFVRNHRGG
jgi:hypothetical protein